MREWTANCLATQLDDCGSHPYNSHPENTLPMQPANLRPLQDAIARGYHPQSRESLRLWHWGNAVSWQWVPHPDDL